jgi:hypothetical protein
MSEKANFWLVFVASITFSIGGFLFGILVPGHAADAGRGGAIGTAIALGFLFINRDYGTRLYRTLIRDVPELKARIDRLKQGARDSHPPVKTVLTIDELETRIEGLVNAILIEGEGHGTESRFLGLATFIGTIIWGFGDLGAQYLINHL